MTTIFLLSGQGVLAIHAALKDFGIIVLPCVYQTCRIQADDPYLRHIPLGLLGVGYFACLAALVGVAMLRHAPTALGLARYLSFAGALAAALLNLRGLSVSGGYCPWCVAHATLCILTAIVVQTLPSDKPMRWRTPSMVASFSLVFWIGSIWAADRELSRPSAMASELSATSRADLLRDSVPITSFDQSPDSGVRYVAFVELGCPACVAFVKTSIQSPDRGKLRLRFVKTTGPTEHAASFLQRNKRHPAYGRMVRWVIDQGPDEASLLRFAKTIAGSLPPGQTAEGTALAKRLGIHLTPTIVYLGQDRPVTWSIDRTLRELEASKIRPAAGSGSPDTSSRR